MDEKARESNRLRQRKFLELHKDEVNDKRREKYHERLSKGKCPRCGNKARKGRTLCADCSEYMLDLNRKYAKRDRAAAGKTTRTKVTAKKTTVKAKAPAKKVPAAAKAKAKPAVKAKTTARAKAPAKTAAKKKK